MGRGFLVCFSEFPDFGFEAEILGLTVGKFRLGISLRIPNAICCRFTSRRASRSPLVIWPLEDRLASAPWALVPFESLDIAVKFAISCEHCAAPH